MREEKPPPNLPLGGGKMWDERLRDESQSNFFKCHFDNLRVKIHLSGQKMGKYSKIAA